MKEFEKMDKQVNDLFETLAAATRPNRNLQDVADHLDDQMKLMRALKGLPKIVHMIIIKKGSQTSLHGSFKKVCKAYGWDYSKLIRGGIPKKHGLYHIKKVETEITIHSMALRRFMEKSFIIENDFDDDWRDTERDHAEVGFDFILDGEVEYRIEASFAMQSYPVSTATDRGEMQEHEWNIDLNEIESVIDCDGEEIKLDLKTEFLLKKHLTI
jgi:hypothetical protein